MNPIYQFTVPVFTKRLAALDAILEKAEAFIKEKGLTDAEMLDRRLAPDMLPFSRQIQIACDNAKNAVARLSGAEVPVFADEEKTLPQLRERVQKTLAILKGADEASFEGAETKQIVMPFLPNMFMNGGDYAREYIVSNFHFHVTIAYALLRKEGLALGKADFMGELPWQPLAA